MPRQRDLWGEFDTKAIKDHEAGVTRYHAVCKKCKAEMCRNLKQTMLPHFIQCHKNAEKYDKDGNFASLHSIKRSLSNALNECDENSNTNAMLNTQPPSAKRPRLTQSSLLSDRYQFNKQVQETVDQCFALWAIRKGISFESFNDPIFHYALNLLCAPYKAIYGDKIKNQLLPEIEKDIKGIVEGRIKEQKSVSLGVDGSNDKHEGLVNGLAFTPTPLLLMTKRSKWEKESAKVLYDYVEDGVKYVKELGAKVDALMADNCSTLHTAEGRAYLERETEARCAWLLRAWIEFSEW